MTAPETTEYAVCVVCRRTMKRAEANMTDRGPCHPRCESALATS